MKRNGTVSKVGKAILISTLAFAVNLRAQTLSLGRPPVITGGIHAQSTVGHPGSERFAEAERTRGYRDGYELGFWTGVQDVRAGLPPVTRPPGFDIRIRTTPYRHGYLAGYGRGYREAFLYPWHLQAW